IYTGKELKAQSQEFLSTHFGKAGIHYFNVVRGIHNSPVKPSRIPKSVGVERTFDTNLSSELFLEDKLKTLSELLEVRLQKNNVAGKTLTLKLKYSDFKIQTRSNTGDYYLSTKALLFEKAKELLYQEKLENSVRLIGISVSNLNTKAAPKKEPLPKKNRPQLEIPF
ncbi:MAG: DNA polymerase IV, partial [Flavobacteriia bacterium]|nr:DNA polymerase IV [Flavobacteriia bacterium]